MSGFRERLEEAKRKRNTEAEHKLVPNQKKMINNLYRHTKKVRMIITLLFGVSVLAIMVGVIGWLFFWEIGWRVAGVGVVLFVFLVFANSFWDKVVQNTLETIKSSGIK